MNGWFAWKKAVRSLTRDRKRSFVLISVFLIVFGMGAFFNDLFYSREENFNHFVAETNMAHGIIKISPSSFTTVATVMNNISEEWIINYEQRFFFITEFHFANGNSNQGILLGINLNQTKHLNSLILENKTTHVMKNNSFGYGYWAVHQDIEKESKISFSYGVHNFSYPIQLIGYNPEWYYYPLNQVGSSISFATPPVFYCDLSRFCKDLGISFYSNEILFQIPENKSISEFSQMIDPLLHANNITLLDIVEFENFPSIKMALMEINNSDLVAPIIIGFFYAFGMIILLVLVNRIITEDIKQVGVFNSIGIYESELQLSFILYILMIILMSLSLGLLGRAIIGKKILEMQFQTVGTPFVQEMSFLPNTTLQVVGIVSLLSIIMNILLVHHLLKKEINHLIHYDIPSFQNHFLIEKRVNKCNFKALHPFSKYSIRKLFQRKGLLVSTLGIIMIAQTGIYLGLGMMDMWNQMGTYKYKEIELWDAYSLTWNVSDHSMLKSEIEELSGINKVELGFLGGSQLLLADANYSVSLFAFEPNSKLHNYIIREGKKPEETKQIVISEDMCYNLHIEIGDLIPIKKIHSYKYNFSNSSQMEDSILFEICGISADTQSDSVYMTLEDICMIMNVPKAHNVIYIQGEHGISDRLSSKIEENPAIAQLVIKENSLKQMQELLDNFAVLYTMIGGSLIILSLIAIFFIMKTHLDGRMKDYLNLKALGMHSHEIWKKVLTEVCGFLLFTIPVGFLVAALFSSKLSTFFRKFSPGVDITLSLINKILLPLITIGITFLGTSFALNNLRKRINR